MKKIISLFTTLCIVFSMLGTFTVFAQDSAADLEISTLAQLEAFRDDVNGGNTYEGKTVKLTADIDMSEKYGEGKESWTPIGTKEQPFNGIFKGLGHMIDNLYINSKNMNSGLFGHTENKSIIKNLTVGGCMNVNTDTNKSQYAGAIAGHNQGIIESCNNEASVNAIEALNGGIISGGIAGFNNGIIRKCTNSGTVSTKTYLVGGICGRNFGLIENCFNAGYVSGKYLIGGLCAQLITCGRISKCFNIGLIDGEDCVGDMAGDDGGTGINNVYYCKPFDEITSDIGTAKTAEQFASGEVAYLLGDEWGQNIGVDEYPVIGGDKVYLVNNTYTNTAPNTETNITEISTLAELEAFRNSVNSGNTYEGKTVKLTADIDMSEKYGEGKESWIPIGIFDWENPMLFSGTFDGDGHTIIGLYINTETDWDTGLFAIVDGTVQNLNVQGYVLTTHISGCAAGLVQQVGENGRILDCSFDGIVESRNYVAAGIASANLGIISGCKFSGKVIGWHLTGAIASNGGEESIIKNCINEGEIMVNLCGGGIVGAGKRIENCVNVGKITGVSRPVAEGYEPETSWGVGGIAGVLNVGGGVENCYNTGEVSGNSEVGGIIGTAEEGWTENWSIAQVKNCYNIGKVTLTMEKDGRHNIGAIIGSREYIPPFDGENDTKTLTSEAIDCYYLSGTAEKGCGGIAEDTATALTSEQFASKKNFANWDFDTVWDIDASLGRPVLRLNREEPPIHTHTLVHHEATDATCTKAGNREYWQCSDCSNVFEDEEATQEIDGIPTIDAKGHTEVTDTAVEPTCETDGKTAGSHCSVCNTIITEQTVIPQLNHKWGEWTITQEPTFFANGKAELVCQNDNTHKQIVELPRLTDRTVWTEEIKTEPTAEKQGLLIYKSEYGNVQAIIPTLQDETYPYKILRLLISDENGNNSIDTIPTNSAFTVEYYLERKGEIYGKTMVAIYDEDGALIAMKSQKTPQAGVTPTKLSRLRFEPTGKTVGSMKVFVWDSFNSMKPLAKVETITFTE
ncbi:MAG: hypothetical protein HFE49_00465 [Clostridia bacterium]|nr:hypothetical protein [Clostridia bacterium]